MESKQRSIRLAQSASIGAGLLGFGIGAKWGSVLTNCALLIIIAGAFIHVLGMCIMRMKGTQDKTVGITKVLWISAWVCLLTLITIFIYLLIAKK